VKPKTEFEVNLHLDYNMLEAFSCCCGKKKEAGQSQCPACYQRMGQENQIVLASMRPGEGMARFVDRHRRL
jgi:hypothetical protein